MPHWTHDWEPTTATHHWFECDDSGGPMRQASFATGLRRTERPAYLVEHAPPEEPFAGSEGAAVTAADRSELAWLREEFGRLGVELHEAAYGIPAEVAAPGGRPVTAAEFERAWVRARRERNFTRITTGPLPEGLHLRGTVKAVPWGAGLTGLFVELGLPVVGFVDVVQLPREPGLWPDVGTVDEFEVLGVRLNCESWNRSRPQVRLRPAGRPRGGEAN